MITILIIIGALFIIGIALVAVLPAAIGAAAPTAIAVALAWCVYRFIRKGLRKVKDITK